MSGSGLSSFSEETFYLSEFRGRTIGFAVPAPLLAEPAPLLEVLETLRRNDSRSLVMSTDREALEQLPGPIVDADAERLEGAVWRALRAHRIASVLATPGESLDEAGRRLGARLGLFKLVRVEGRADGAAPIGRGSFVHLAQLDAMIAEERARQATERVELLEAVRAMLLVGIPAVNICTLEGLHRELFSYAGSGTLFTRQRYVHVRSLGIEDFDAAEHLIRRGEEEGYLAPRKDAEIDALLASGFGAFVEGRHLAGIGALRPFHSRPAGELSSLYTLTRYLGEGIGPHLVDFALARGLELGLEAVFACTTSARAGGFFERHGFEAVDADALPPEKWQGYDPARRAIVRCYRARPRPTGSVPPPPP